MEPMYNKATFSSDVKQINSPEEFPDRCYYLLIAYKQIQANIPDSSWDRNEQLITLTQCEHYVSTEINTLIPLVDQLEHTNIKYVVLQVSNKGKLTKTITFPVQNNQRSL